MQLSDLLPEDLSIRFISTGTGTSAANPDEWIAEHGENNKIEEGSSKLLSCLSNKDLLDSSYTNQSYRVLLTNIGV